MNLFPIFIGLALAQILLGSIEACSCAPSLPPLKALAQADAVFSGEVISLSKQEIRYGEEKTVVAQIAKVAVKKSWKGKISGEVEVHTAEGQGDCGFPFKGGHSYLIYATRDKEGQLQTNICMRTGLLKEADNEILELEGRSPKPRKPAAPPSLQVIGKINDAGYEGLVFSFHNRLHERIYVFHGSSNTHRVQIYENNVWMDYAPNCGASSRKDLSADEASTEFERWKNSYEGMETKISASYLDRLSSTRNFIAIPTTSKTWRVGLQYITEAEFNGGKEIQRSKHVVWSDAIAPSLLISVPQLTFEIAFQQESK